MIWAGVAAGNFAVYLKGLAKTFQFYGIAIFYRPRSSFIDFSTSWVFPSGKTLGLRLFSLNSRLILNIFEAKPRIFQY